MRTPIEYNSVEEVEAVIAEMARLEAEYVPATVVETAIIPDDDLPF
jgi:hypothetical protein